MDIFAQIPTWTLVAAFAVTFLGGFVKGAVGFAMPLVMISGMGLFIDPYLVVAGIIIPILVTNLMQVLRGGLSEALAAAREHWLYITLVCSTIFISAQFLRLIPTNAMFVVLGVPVAALSLIQLVGLRFQIAPDKRRRFEVLAGLISGMLGGLAGTWGPPTVLYLLALNTPRAKQLVVQGVVYGLGAVTLFAGHIQSGVLNTGNWLFSVALVLPAMLGMLAGFRAGNHMDQDRFRRITLFVLMVAGLNLIRRGLIG